MKKLTSILAIASMIFFTSCNKDDEQQNQTTNNAPKTQLEILQDGSWDLVSMRSVVSSSDTVFFDETEQMVGTVTFLQNNTVVSVLAGEGNDTSSYVFKQNSITIDDLDFDIETLTANKLELKSVESEMDDDLGILITLTTEISLKK